MPGVAYAPIVPWWYVAGQSKNGLFNFLLIVTDGFVMLTLFFILGAGLDTFAFRRRDLLDRLVVYEIDHPATQEFKLHRLEAL